MFLFPIFIVGTGFVGEINNSNNMANKKKEKYIVSNGYVQI